MSLVRPPVSGATPYRPVYLSAVARPRYPKKGEPLPPPLPPASRTVGQLVAESLHVYGAHFPVGLAIGVLPAVVGVVSVELGGWRAVVLGAVAGAAVQTGSYVVACAIVGGVPLRMPDSARAFAVGVLVFLPVPFLAVLFLLPALVWLALFGLAVPVALLERCWLGAALQRAFELARADLAHVVGGLATLAILVLVSQGVVAFTLREFSDQTEKVAALIAAIVLAPIVFFGAAILYVDQEARWVARSAAPVEVVRKK